MASLRRIQLSGFKSINEMDLELRPLNVLIGANGAGKSNLVSFFKMLHEMMAGRFQKYVATSGHAHSLLHFGPKTTPEMSARIEIGDDKDQGCNAYTFRLSHAAVDSLVFTEETLIREDFLTPTAFGLGAGHLETQLQKVADDPSAQSCHTACAIRHWLDTSRVFHFHDTSLTARIRQFSYVNDSRRLRSDGGNLAAVLHRLQKIDAASYRRIVNSIRLIAPFFGDFAIDELTGGGESIVKDENDLSSTDGSVHLQAGIRSGRERRQSGNGTDVILNWRDTESDEIFGPHQLSDGTLRAMSLITLLLQPENELPELIIVDEPELGLHPYAISLIASLFKKASHHTQVLVCTQSTTFLDHFDPEDVIVVDREGKESKFTRPDSEQLESWLEEYSLGEVWEKNVIGGGPH